MTTTNLTLAVGARERRARILAAFARLLLGCKHTFDLSESPEAMTVMQARQELYVEALQPYPLHVIELAATRCVQAESGWFPAAGEWCAACRDVLNEQAQAARRQPASVGPVLSREQRLANLSRLVAMVKARVKGMR